MTSTLRQRTTTPLTSNGVRSGGATGEDEDPRPLQARAGEGRVDGGRWRSGLEIPRKLLHSSIALVVLFLWTSHASVPKILRYLGWATVVIGGTDVVRMRSKRVERAYEVLVGRFMRESERHAVNGTLYYLVGVLWCLSLYPRDIAVLSVIQLSLCDTSASIFGRLFGRYTPSLPFAGSLFGAKKSLAGTLAAVLTGTAASYVFWSRFAQGGDEGDVSWVEAGRGSQWVGGVMEDPLRGWGVGRLPNPHSTLSLPTLVIVNGLTAGLAEAIDVWGLDDNLSLPVLFGFFCWASMWVLG